MPQVAAALIAVVLYANSLPNGFTYDDFPVVARNEAAYDPADLRHRGALESLCASARIVPLPRPRSMVGALASLAAGAPFSLGYFSLPRLRHLVRAALLALRPDVIFVSGTVMAQYLPDELADRAGAGAGASPHGFGARVAGGGVPSGERSPVFRLAGVEAVHRYGRPDRDLHQSDGLAGGRGAAVRLHG